MLQQKMEKQEKDLKVVHSQLAEKEKSLEKFGIYNLPM